MKKLCIVLAAILIALAWTYPALADSPSPRTPTPTSQPTDIPTEEPPAPTEVIPTVPEPTGMPTAIPTSTPYTITPPPQRDTPTPFPTLTPFPSTPTPERKHSNPTSIPTPVSTLIPTDIPLLPIAGAECSEVENNEDSEEKDNERDTFLLLIFVLAIVGITVLRNERV